MRTVIVAGASLALSMAIRLPAQAQSAGGMDHSSHMGAAATVAPPGQDAYAALAAVVAVLEADSTTDWTKVNIEALRRHLIAMNDVTLRARSRQTNVPGGARMDVTGDGRVAESIRAMLHSHATMLNALGPYRAIVEDISGGVRFTVSAADPRDQKTVAKIRGLGFSGLLTLGAHHAQHHLALARGQSMMH
jgi:hypothetical protein